MRRTKLLAAFVAAAAIVALASAGVAFAAPSGAIFTTTASGAVVNENTYTSKAAVYLDGGPGPNAPASAAGLPDGWYYFQVTDPSGKVLLSTDPIEARQFRVAGGLIVEAKTHVTGTDVDHNAMTVQLMPYNTTPNPGGVYKVWATPQSAYDPAKGFFGFLASASKTDNFKVREFEYTPAKIEIRKFKDLNWNSVWDVGEPEIIGWEVTYVDPTGVSNKAYTPAEIIATKGSYVITESMVPDWLQTSLWLDGVNLFTTYYQPTVTVVVNGTEGESHTVWYGNMICDY
jgi:hypothetical protein